MVGLNKGSISQAFADVTVTGFNYVGGLVGSNHGVVFQYAWGNVSGNDSSVAWPATIGMDPASGR